MSLPADDPAASAGTSADAMPSLGREIGELARLHVDLARSEVRFGHARFVAGVVLAGCAIVSGALALGSAGLALYLALTPEVSSTAAALLVGALFTVLTLCLALVARRWIRDGGSVWVPRTRAMLREMWECDSADRGPTNS